jgi:hypothetical protein
MKRSELSGNKFGRLEVISFSCIQNGNSLWNCKCDCGKEKVVAACHLKSGHTSSCGCLLSETTSSRSKTHGESVFAANTKEYRIWNHMKTRCSNPRSNRFNRYGGRGITVCDRWKNSFENFLFDMGRCPEGMSIDRIENNGNYEPDNCKWSTAKEQAANRSKKSDQFINRVAA